MPKLPTPSASTDSAPRAGRRRGPKPKSPGERREHVVMLRLNDAELARLEQLRGSAQRARWMRDRVLGTGAASPRQAAVPELNRQAWVELSRLGSNLNQLARAANEGKRVDKRLLDGLRATYAQLSQVRQLLVGERAVGEKKRE